MTFNVTSVSDSLADITVTDFVYNITDGRVVLFPAESLWVVNTQTREVVKVMSGDNVTGHLEPYWISPNVSAGSVIDAYFGTYAQVQEAEAIQALGQTRDCWMVTLEWPPAAAMERWYDQSTGIVLLIITNLTRGGIRMNVTETATSSNIQMLARKVGTNSFFLSLLPYLGLVLGSGLLLWGLAYLRHRKEQASTAVRAHWFDTINHRREPKWSHS